MKPVEDRNPAPDFTLKDANGSPFNLSDYRGRVVLLNFWATWCPPCSVEVPWFNEFEKRYKERGLAVVAISVDEDGWGAVKPYIQAKSVSYRVAVGSDELVRLYGGIDSLPTTFLIDKEGRIASVHFGLAGKSDYEDEIRYLLGGDKHGDAGGLARN